MLKLFSVLIWSLVYFYSSKQFIYEKWGASVFKLGQWKSFIADWHSGEWVIDTPNEYKLVACLILWIPLWLIGIYVIMRLFRSKKQAIVRQATASHPFIPAYTPMQMPSQGKSTQLDVSPTFQNTQQQAIQNSNMQSTTQNQKNVQMDYVPNNQGEAQALEKITELAQEFGLTAFPHVLLENQLVPITISSDSDAFLIKVLAEPGLWQVPMTEPVENGIWINNGQNKVVLKEIVAGKKALINMEPDSVVTPVVVLAQGGLANADTVLPWLNQHGIEVVTLSENQQQGIAKLNDIIVKYFPEEKNMEEENEISQTSVV